VIAVAAGTGDALVSGAGTAALCVLTADCASVALGSDEGVFGAVHGGWRGLVGGVVEATAAAMRDLGASRVVGALGPCIHRGCYEFSEPELDAVAARYGATVRGRTLGGRPALDLPATVSAALAAAGVEEATGVDACTACAGRYFSHRARGDQGRQALLVWSGGGSDPR
jgi:copper oxidase (laccase) domain-containing protein